jgi:hypothetical protein
MKLHTIWFLYLSTLAFFPRKFDVFNMTIVELLMISWIIFNNECLVSLMIKKKQDPGYVAGSDTSATDIKEDIGPVLYRLGQITYKLNFLYVFLRMSNYNLTPQFWALAAYLFTVVNGLVIKTTHWWYVLIIMLIFNCPTCPLNSKRFLSLLS